MEIRAEEGKKIDKAFDVLGFSKKERAQHLEKIGEALLMDVAAEAYIEKGENFGGELSDKDDVAKFLLEKCSQEEIKELTALVFRDAVVEYFSKLLKDLPDEKKTEIEPFLNAIE